VVNEIVGQNKSKCPNYVKKNFMISHFLSFRPNAGFWEEAGK
jgi:hypothetical protein